MGAIYGSVYEGARNRCEASKRCWVYPQDFSERLKDDVIKELREIIEDGMESGHLSEHRRAALELCIDIVINKAMPLRAKWLKGVPMKKRFTGTQVRGTMQQAGE